MSAIVSLIRQSLDFDFALLRIVDLPLMWRVRFLFAKYVALCQLVLNLPSTISVGPLCFHVDSLSSLGTFQSNIVDFYEVIVRPGHLTNDRPTILDIGANVGQFCLAAKLFFPLAKVISFEADPDTFAFLRRNAEYVPGVSLHNIALASRNEHRTFFRHELSGMSSFRPYPGHSYDDVAKQIDLTTHRLDDVIERVMVFDLVKIDVEGYELEVLNGGTTVLRLARLLLIELRLCSSPENEPNLDLFNTVSRLFPAARLLRCGRALGPAEHPVSQDLLFDVSSREDLPSHTEI
jgi:FkbM family methyltransferase